jgi:N-acetylglucosamine-6-phosphate deacetylase
MAAHSGVLVEATKVAAIVPPHTIDGTVADEIVDAGSGYICPGYVDLHTHGIGGYSFDGGAEQFSAICRLLPRYGVTGVLATFIPKPKGADAAYVAQIARTQTEGAEVLGFHFEGPFISLPGAVPPEHLKNADAERVQSLKNAASSYRAIFSVSAEFDGILHLIPLMAAGQTPVFITHTRATVEQTLAAIDAGVTHATHFYNVFPSPPEKEPGVRPCGAVEAVLADRRVTVDFILDGEHVDTIAVKLGLQCKGIDGVSLVTDSNIGAGVAPGTVFDFGSYKIAHHYAGGPARICSSGALYGALAGSGLTMDQAVRNAVKLLGVDLVTAVLMASTNPARIAGYGTSKGRIEPGYDADLVLLDQDLQVRETWVKGVSVFRA